MMAKVEARPSLRTGDVARMFGVDPKTVTVWARTKVLPESFRTPGGERRWYLDEVQAVLDSTRPER